MRAVDQTVTRRGPHHPKPNHPKATSSQENPYKQDNNPLSISKSNNKPLQNPSRNTIAMAPYVIQGFHFFLRHKSLWKLCLWPIFYTFLFVIASLCILVPLAFIPQAIALSTVMTPFLGVPLALMLALLEILIVVMIFSALVLLPITDKLNDRVLTLRGHGALVEADDGWSLCGCCSRVKVLQIMVFVLTLPLCLIPVAGLVAWLFINGRWYTWDAHSHYHKDLKKRSFSTQRKFVKQHWYAYHMFGMQAMALEMIPGVNVLFVFTNGVAAGLWAADLEDELLLQQQQQEQQEPKVQSTIKGNNYHHPTEETALSDSHQTGI